MTLSIAMLCWTLGFCKTCVKHLLICKPYARTNMNRFSADILIIKKKAVPLHAHFGGRYRNSTLRNTKTSAIVNPQNGF